MSAQDYFWGGFMAGFFFCAIAGFFISTLAWQKGEKGK
jgi:hypothetical protein